MAMAFIWIGIVLFSLVFSLFAGTSAEVGKAALDGATAAVKLAIEILGPTCLWCGVMEVMRRGGLADGLSRLLRPILTRLFPSTRHNADALTSVSANVSANLLGLGNAATPLGIRAATAFSRDAAAGVATDDMCMLVVMNTASIQLIPSTVAAVRSSLGSAAPFDILPAVWVTSIASVTAGICAAKLLRRLWR
ncbi:MAG: spore maturation protein A [Oscillospiraceae bacterium]|jgi:spore maturation protein A|nr:spore maturation protein A [Oscillospiraceae bacterium]